MQIIFHKHIWERARECTRVNICIRIYVYVNRIDRRCDGRKKRSESNRRIAIAFTYAYSGCTFCVFVDPANDLNSRADINDLPWFFSLLSLLYKGKYSWSYLNDSIARYYAIWMVKNPDSTEFARV